MKLSRLAMAVLGTASLGASMWVMAADKMDIGKREYNASCAVCHGADAKGGGSFAELLPVKVPDLTTLAKKNGGVFPIARVYDVIDGREAVKAHGTREMPIWGRQLTYRAAPQYDDYAYDAEAFARSRMLFVIDYLYRMQVK